MAGPLASSYTPALALSLTVKMPNTAESPLEPPASLSSSPDPDIREAGLLQRQKVFLVRARRQRLKVCKACMHGSAHTHGHPCIPDEVQLERRSPWCQAKCQSLFDGRIVHAPTTDFLPDRPQTDSYLLDQDLSSYTAEPSPVAYTCRCLWIDRDMISGKLCLLE